MVSGDINSGEEVHYEGSCPYKEDAKKWRGWETEGSVLYDERADHQARKDRQIVNQLKEFVNSSEYDGNWIREQLRKILKGKEEVRTDGDREVGMEY